MQKKKQTKSIKKIIILTILAILLLLLIFAEDIVKLTNSNKTALLENTPNESIEVEPNIPVLSAGMIPIKWNGTNFVITTQEDKDWYDYKNGKPAYIMLNDGYYQSELKRGITNEQLMANAVGNDALVVPNVENNNPTILMWIPRFAINNETNEIKYIKGIEQTDENCTIPEIFTHKQETETAPDVLLTGIWLEKNIDANFTNKIAQMNSEESIYGFIKNTIALSSNQTTQNEIQNYIANTVGNDAPVVPQIPDPLNSNRIILHILNANNQNPIKAKAIYNKDTGLIEVQVTYSQYGIAKILYENTQELKLTKNGNKATATSEGLDIEVGDRTITIIDKKGNRKQILVGVIPAIYVTFYPSDGTLAFATRRNPLPEKETYTAYDDISESEWTSNTQMPWYNVKSNITTVEFVDKIAPISTSYWFYSCSNLTTINNIENLDTRNVTNMKRMFYGCSSLTMLDLNNFDTKKVTDMNCMLSGCSSLTILNLSNFNTKNVTDIGGMFNECSSLTSLNLSNFDISNVSVIDSIFCNCRSLTILDLSNLNISNVTDLQDMFYGCSSLTILNLNNLDTSNVTNVRRMFYNCSSLSQITFGEKWDKEITLPTLTKPCAGWYSDEGFTNKVADAGASYNPNGAITIYANVPPDIFAKLYTDGTLAFCSNNSQIPFKELSQDYGNIGGQEYSINTIPWKNERASITELEFIDKVQPISTNSYFWHCENLATIKYLTNSDTSKVTTMQAMFQNCSGLTSLNLTSFNTAKVTNMSWMFQNCRSLRTIYVSSSTWVEPEEKTSRFNNCGTSTLTKQ